MCFCPLYNHFTLSENFPRERLCLIYEFLESESVCPSSLSPPNVRIAHQVSPFSSLLSFILYFFSRKSIKMNNCSSSNNLGHPTVCLDVRTDNFSSSVHSRVGTILAGNAFLFYGFGRQSQTTRSLPVQGNLARVKQAARLRRGIVL